MKNYLMEAIESLVPNSDYVIFGDEYSGIEWRDTVNIKPTEEEINEKIKELKTAEPFKQLRDERNQRLAECDWIVTKNAEYGHNISEEWRNYRQALRDLPSITYKPELDEYGDLKMDSVAWPTPPE
tara:strand:- start:4 stop:381 length:378 start_codon:yes stop_codon:yes gene_type:complete